ncbi:hypothetical protein MRX96_004069 [Rhipicephalus microplus]
MRVNKKPETGKREGGAGTPKAGSRCLVRRTVGVAASVSLGGSPDGVRMRLVRWRLADRRQLWPNGIDRVAPVAESMHSVL